ncbi:hypothetical protein [Paenibacillus sp. PL2-23]|uniref:hypothetical protein n=1 Tax=Paenibacillus sp. PL2-23 TaxID=2100729 RepID=UPI0030FA595B
MKTYGKAILCAVAAVIAGASIWQAAPAYAGQAPTAAAPTEELNVKGEGEVAEAERHRIHMSKEDFEAYRLKKLQAMAEYFGIETEGKSAQQLKDELAVAKEANKEKWEAFKAEHQAKRLEHLQKIAGKHGIQTDGKTEEQLREELMKVHGGKEHRRWKARHEHNQHNGSSNNAKPQQSPQAKPDANAAPVPSREKHT